jgi:hypothetical protein
MSRKRKFAELATTDCRVLDSLVDLLQPIVLETTVNDSMIVPLIKGSSITQAMACKIAALSHDVVIRPNRLVVFKADSDSAKRNRLDSAHRLNEHRSEASPSDEVKRLGEAVSDRCTAVMTHMRRHLDMADVKVTNIVVTEVGANTYQMQTKGLRAVPISDAVDLGAALQVFEPDISYWWVGDPGRTDAPAATATRSACA